MPRRQEQLLSFPMLCLLIGLKRDRHGDLQIYFGCLLPRLDMFELPVP